jgi:hypothetical protein
MKSQKLRKLSTMFRRRKLQVSIATKPIEFVIQFNSKWSPKVRWELQIESIYNLKLIRII